ncbi:hypothetical protein ACNKHV_05695 [Shigella flexneri]
MNPSGVIPLAIPCYMVKKGTRKDAFTLKKVIGNMLLPLPLMLLIIGAGLALLWFSRFQKPGRFLLALVAGALLLSLQPVADRLLRPSKAPIRHGIIRKK